MEPNTRLVIGGPQGTERTVSLAETDITVGRATTNDVVLSDAKASRAHAQLVYSDAQWTLVDLESANGTLLNGQPVLERVPLRPGDVITVGDSTLHFDTGPGVLAGPLVIDTAAELDATLADVTVPVQLNDTRVARLAIQTPTGTWELPLEQEALLIGRQSDCDVVLSLERVSRQHARIERRGDAFWLRDLDSTNGTFLAGRRIEEQPLHDGDTVRIGDAQLVFKQATLPDDLTLVDAGGASSTRGAGRPRQPVVFVPGLMGSELWLGSEKVWPNVRLLFTQPEIFTLPETSSSRSSTAVPATFWKRRWATSGAATCWSSPTTGATTCASRPAGWPRPSTPGRSRRRSPSSPTAWARWSAATTSSGWAARTKSAASC